MIETRSSMNATQPIPIHEIIPLPDNPQLIQQAAQLLVEGFAEHWPDAWPTLDEAIEEVKAMLAVDRLCCIALDENGYVLGWIGGILEYDGLVWELHPMVVRQDL